MFRQHIQGVDFLGVSGRVHFKNGDRLSNILIKQKFASRSVAIGQFAHAHGQNDTYAGGLEWDPDKITWATGRVPRDLLPGEASNLRWLHIVIIYGIARASVMFWMLVLHSLLHQSSQT